MLSFLVLTKTLCLRTCLIFSLLSMPLNCKSSKVLKEEKEKIKEVEVEKEEEQEKEKEVEVEALYAWHSAILHVWLVQADEKYCGHDIMILMLIPVRYCMCGTKTNRIHVPSCNNNNRRSAN